MKGSHVLGIIVAITLISFGIAYPTPEKQIKVSSYRYDMQWTDEYGEEYVGGDAYNYQMEASLKAGYMGGVLALKGISIAGGLLLFFLSLYAGDKSRYMENQLNCLQEISKKLTDLEKGQTAIRTSFEKQRDTMSTQINPFQQSASAVSSESSTSNPPVSGRHASSRSKPSKTKEKLSHEILERVEQLNNAEEIYNFVVSESDPNDEEIVKFLAILQKSVITERMAGNNKAGAISLVRSFLSHDMKVFHVERIDDRLICPVCGKEQRSDRHSCRSCGALFQI